MECFVTVNNSRLAYVRQRTELLTRLGLRYLHFQRKHTAGNDPISQVVSMSMNVKANVLVVSRDEMLLRTREMILGAFFSVKGAGRFSEAKTLITETNFDLVVLCHSLTNDECEHLADLAHRQNPRPLVLAMSANGNGGVKPWADKQLGVEEGPYGLLKKCFAMLGFVLKSKARAAQV